MTVSATKLLPCPFCGGDPKWTLTNKIKCDSDDCFGPKTTGVDDSAIEQWNKRTPIIKRGERKPFAYRDEALGHGESADKEEVK